MSKRPRGKNTLVQYYDFFKYMIYGHFHQLEMHRDTFAEIYAVIFMWIEIWIFLTALSLCHNFFPCSFSRVDSDTQLELTCQ